MRERLPVLAAAASLAFGAGCSGGGEESEPDPTPTPGLSVSFVDAPEFVDEEAPTELTVHVVLTTGGQVASELDGTLTLSSEDGPVLPPTLPIEGGVATGTITLERGGLSLVSASAGAGVTPATHYYYALPRLPAKVAGSGPEGSVLGEGAGWDAAGAWGAAVAADGATLRLWYTAAATSGGTPSIGLAESTDGVAFARVGSAPVLGPGAAADACHADGAQRPAVIASGGGWLMLYVGLAGGERHLCRATSADGAAWTVTAGGEANGAVFVASPQPDRFDNTAITGAALGRDSAGNLVLLYSAEGDAELTVNSAGPEQLAGIGYAVSTDEGLTWTRLDGAGPAGSVFTGFAQSIAGPSEWDAYGMYGPALLQDGPVWRLWMTGVSDGGALVGYRAGVDPLDFGPHVENYDAPYDAILVKGATGAFDADGIELPAVVEFAGARRLYYTGRAGGVRRIGLAVFPALP